MSSQDFNYHTLSTKALNPSLASPDATPAESKDINVNPSPPIRRTPFRVICIFPSALRLLYIIIGNCICSVAIALCLWDFSKQQFFDRRVFNVVILLLSVALGLGIGFLTDKIGLMAQGALLQSRAHPPRHISYIVRGTFSSYALLFLRRPRNLVVLFYLLSAICGRFGVAFLGFGYNLSDVPTYLPARTRPDWVNLAISRPEDLYMRLNPDPSLPTSWKSLSNATLPSMSDFAQYAKGIPLVLQRGTSDKITVDPEIALAEIREAGRFDNYKSMGGLELEMVGTKVVQRYLLQDFFQSSPLGSGWEVKVESSCWRYDLPDNQSGEGKVSSGQTLNTLDFTNVERYGKKVSVPKLYSSYNETAKGPLDDPTGGFRWIMKVLKTITNMTNPESEREKTWRIESANRGETHSLWLMGVSMNSTELLQLRSTNLDPPIVKTAIRKLEEEYIPNKPLLFNCSFSIEELPSWGSPIPVHTDVQVTDEGAPGILGESLYDFLVTSPVAAPGFNREGEGEMFDSNARVSTYELENFRDKSEALNFHWAISRQKQEESEIWLAAYVGRFIVNQLSFLNTLLTPIEIETSFFINQSILTVNWLRIALVLGALLVFQVLVSVLALWYCQGKFELVDDVTTLSSVLGGFSEIESNQRGMDFVGWFVQEEDGFRWALFKHE